MISGQRYQYLFDYSLLVDETYQLYLSSSFRTRKRIDLPYLFDTLAPHQLWYSLLLVVPDIDDFAVINDLVIICPLLFSLSSCFFLYPRILFEYQPYT